MAVLRILVAVLLAGVVSSAVFFQVPHPAWAQSSIPLSQEYTSGDIQVYPYLQAWYSWVNINNTHTIFLALHSNQAPSPVFSFVGQAYNTSSGSRVFVGNAILAMEVYNDTDRNGYLDANYTIPTTELLYTLVMNASQTFTPYSVNKTIVNGIPHYEWGITYGNIQAILVKADPSLPGSPYGEGMAASYTTIDYVTMYYDLSLNENTTILKTSYQIGNVTLTPPTDPGVTLKGLSLSLLHATLTVASKSLTVVAGSSPYNSQNNTAASPFNAAQVKVDNVLAYEFRFRDNYTLLTSPPKVYPAIYVASPIDSLPSAAFQGNYFTPLIRVQNFVQGQLPDIAGLPSTSNLNYSASQFLYRINYPTWSGFAINHDPTYVAHIKAVSSSSPPPSQPPPSRPPNKSPTNPPQAGLPITIVYAAVATGVLALLIAVNGMRRRGRTVQPMDEPRDAGDIQAGPSQGT